MAKLGLVIDDWMADNDLQASALQCWTSMEEYYGIVPCAVMSMMSNNLMPSACETDIAGVVGMYAMTLASGGLGGSVLSDNISVQHVMNIKRVAYETTPPPRDALTLAPGVQPRGEAGAPPTTLGYDQDEQLEDIIRRVLKELGKA